MLLDVLTQSIIPFWKALMTPDSYLNPILKKKTKKRMKKRKERKEREKDQVIENQLKSTDLPLDTIDSRLV